VPKTILPVLDSRRRRCDAVLDPGRGGGAPVRGVSRRYSAGRGAAPSPAAGEALPAGRRDAAVLRVSRARCPRRGPLRRAAAARPAGRDASRGGPASARAPDPDRNEVHNNLPDGTDFSIANNCLERGLWEVKLARARDGKTVTVFHAWLTFPKDEYGRLFREANGIDYEPFDGVLAAYPGVGGFVLSLDALRKVKSEKALAALDVHPADAVDRLPEQKNKTRLLKTEVATYGDFARPDKQPITMAKFNVPGLYDPAETMRFDLAWLARPSRILWREAESPRAAGPFREVEVDFENGYRVLLADAKLAGLPARSDAPAVESDVLKLVCGIGTPIIHASAAERAAELAEDRPRYLMILDAKGNHVDNHLTGVDGVYAWRDAGDPGRLHLWFVSYERIALVAHFSARWPAPS
jgi:hypothetical protein